MAVEEAMVDAVARHGLLSEGRPVVVLFSGGRDSTCLLDLAIRVSGRQRVAALHVNYRLRDSAHADERHCAQVCEQLGVALEVRRPVRPSTSGNVEAWAREERYRAARQIALARDADVASGHTASDQIETILYRLASSPSRRALLGMREREPLGPGGPGTPGPLGRRGPGSDEGRGPPITDTDVPGDPSLVRPLLDFSREQTAAYCQEHGLSWREDETNESSSLARNRIRQWLVPALLSVHPAARENVLALAEILREEAAALDALVEDALGGRTEIELSRLRTLPPALRRLVVQRLADAAAGGLAAGAARRAEEIAALRDQGTAELDLGGGVRAIAEYGVLRFETSSSAEPVPEPVWLPVPGEVRFGRFEVRCELAPPTVAEPGVLDRGELGTELLVRSWRRGDRMAPLGLGGTKSLQDLFTARRVPRRERGAVAVVEAGGEIAWVAGVATSERFKVTDATKETVRLSAHKLDPGDRRRSDRGDPRPGGGPPAAGA